MPFFHLVCHGHQVPDRAERWKLASSSQHGHVADAMTVVPRFRESERLNCPATGGGRPFESPPNFR
jgi:hypothetical protein